MPGGNILAMRLTSFDQFIFVTYMLAVLGVGLWAACRGTNSKRDYFLAGDKLPWWMIGGSIVAANISSHHLIGVMGTAYERGFVAIVIEWGAILVGFNALLWIFLPYYLRNGFYTVPEYLDRRFGAGVRSLYVMLILLTYVLVEIGAVLYMGAIALHSLVGIPISHSIIVLAAITGLYTILGGLRAVVWTEMLQLGVLLFGGVALAIATIQAVGGVRAVLETSESWDLLLPASDPDFPWTMYLGSVLCISTFYCAANQFIVQRALAAKDEWHARMGIVFASYLKFILPLIIVVPGLVAPKLLPNLPKADLVFPMLVESLLPTGFVGLVMAGLIAAIMGHTSGAINSCTTIATIDFFLPFKRWLANRDRLTPILPDPRIIPLSTNPHAREDVPAGQSSNFAKRPHDATSSLEDNQAVVFGRFAGIAVVLMGIVSAMLFTEHSQKPIFIYLLAAYGYFTPGIATMFLLGIFWRRTTSAGALAAGLLTIPLTLAIQWTWPSVSFQNRTGIVFWTCIVVCTIVSLLTTPKSPAELANLIWTKDSLRVPPEERYRYRGLRNPVLWWALVTSAVLYFYVRYA